MFLRASLVLALGLLFISCLSGAQGLDYAIEWYTGNPAFAGTDPINSCFTGGAQNRTYFCTTINLYDTVFWFIPAAASVNYVSYVRATDSTFNYTVQNFKYTALPDFFSGDANAANELTANQYFSYQFVDSGTFYFINPNETTVMLGAVTVLNQTSIDRQTGSSTFDDNVSTFDDVLSIIVLVLLSISIGGALLPSSPSSSSPRSGPTPSSSSCTSAWSSSSATCGSFSASSLSSVMTLACASSLV
jgi:hypothetical protein